MSDGGGGTGPRLNRRTLLAAITTVGTVGAVTGRGAAAYLLDREALATNRMTAGAVMLALDNDDATGRVNVGFVVDDYGYENRDEREVCLGLADDSNPGWVWLRACPRVPAVEDDLSATVSHEGSTVFSGSLGGLLNTLAGGDGGGVLLTDFLGAAETPVAPGPDGTVCLTVAIWAPSSLADDPDAVRALKATSPLALAIDVYAEQSRHVPAPRRPVAASNPSFAFPACEEPEDPPEETGYGISNVSLCTDGPVDPGSVTWIVRDLATGADVTGDPGEAYVVEVSSPVPIDSVVVKAGPEFRRFEAGGATTLTVSSSGGTVLDVPTDFARCACEGDGLKLDDWSEASGTFTALEPLSCGEGGGDGPPGPTEEETETDDDGPGQGRTQGRGPGPHGDN